MEKPILFNSEMINALSEDRKTSTRRIVKHLDKTPQSFGRDKFYGLTKELNGKPGFFAAFYNDSSVFMHEGKEHVDSIYFKSPYEVGDILWVRETWMPSFSGKNNLSIKYKADGKVKDNVLFSPERYEKFSKFVKGDGEKWQPSLFMPREAARLFLRVNKIRVELLQDITKKDIISEGTNVIKSGYDRDDYEYGWISLWNSTCEKKEHKWESNPWVWVFEFEKIIK